jgi:SAM-dependent methyltransferase
MNQENQAFYTSYYGDEALSQWRASGARDKARHIVKLCRDVAAGSILEVGCGDGSVLAELSHLGFGERFHGLEISASGVEIARSRNIPRLISIDTFDGETLPFDTAAVDLVYCTHVLEHVAHERLFLAELARVGRHVFVEVPLEDTMRVAKAVVNDIGHINFYNRVTFRTLLEEFFAIERFEVFDHSREVLAMARSRVPAPVRSLLRSTCLAIAPAMAQSLFVYHAAALCRPRT